MRSTLRSWGWAVVAAFLFASVAAAVTPRALDGAVFRATVSYTAYDLVDGSKASGQQQATITVTRVGTNVFTVGIEAPDWSDSHEYLFSNGVLFAAEGGSLAQPTTGGGAVLKVTGPRGSIRISGCYMGYNYVGSPDDVAVYFTLSGQQTGSVP